MTSAPSDSESNLSGFIRYSDKDYKRLYTSMIEVCFTLYKIYLTGTLINFIFSLEHGDDKSRPATSWKKYEEYSTTVRTAGKSIGCFTSVTAEKNL